MNWLVKERELFLPVFKRLPLEIESGRGVYLFDRRGRRYLDFFSGLGVNALGYQHPRVLSAIQGQLRRNLHLSNYFVQDIQIALAEMVLKFSGFHRLFFTNSGTESIEGILKLVKKWARLNRRDHIICFENAFHGRTLGSLSITAQEKYQRSFAPLLPGIKQIPFNDTAALRRVVNPRTAAIFLEFVQGEGGVRPAGAVFVKTLQDLKDKYKLLLVADEIQAGVGRTGRFLSCQHYPVQPDLVALAKALGGGLPLGAFLVNRSLADVLGPGEHGTTFGGNPLSCAAGMAIMQELEENRLLEHVQQMGIYLMQSLKQMQQEFPDKIREVRGMGFMLGMELTMPANSIVLTGLQKGIILNSTAGTVLRFLPPLIIQREEIDEGIDKLRNIFAGL